MESQETPIHKVLVSNTTPLFDLIKELGFEEEKSEGYGINVVHKFKKGDKYIYSSHYSITLSQINLKTKEKVITYSSLTIHDEDLKFFARRDPIEIKNK